MALALRIVVTTEDSFKQVAFKSLLAAPDRGPRGPCGTSKSDGHEAGCKGRSLFVRTGDAANAASLEGSDGRGAGSITGGLPKHGSSKEGFVEEGRSQEGWSQEGRHQEGRSQEGEPPPLGLVQWRSSEAFFREGPGTPAGIAGRGFFVLAIL